MKWKKFTLFSSQKNELEVIREEDDEISMFFSQGDSNKSSVDEGCFNLVLLLLNEEEVREGGHFLEDISALFSSIVAFSSV